MQNFNLALLGTVTTPERQTEFVERKGIGHPDTICDGIAESISLDLSQTYIQRIGHVLHHNIDKGLLVAGQTSPALGGGIVNEPMRLVIGDRATAESDGYRISIDEIAISSAKNWIRDNLRLVNPDKHLVFQNELKTGSPELTDIFARKLLCANDTSAAVGYAPLSETEQLVLATERRINSDEFKAAFPETGEDVKVMGVRRDRSLYLTVAVAMVDYHFKEAQQYFDRKRELQQELTQFLEPQLKELDQVQLEINTLDDPERGLGGMYLTVLGTSAEGADGGQVGRGNRVNGLITLNRPMSTEAAAGKNPVSHVGKIYNVFSHYLADQIYKSIAPVREVCVRLCSQIGREISDPWMMSVEVVLSANTSLADIEPALQEIVQKELAGMDDFVLRLSRGEFSVY
ncbi:methionine adenosyltransferase [uncultured Gimesia sp.]|uniref:methionine adenosyltransferase n=1 Tax=uncultured Gimesia sp. TaxID=1678688 RepID=UPI0030DCD88F|tara:strand:- start:130860 stop:132065 length:1206 start_codon:yes stop_codon:yes gene_type:complete